MDENIESLTYRIISGYYYINIDNIEYKILLPTLKVKNEAHKLYLKIINDNKYDISSWITKQTIDNLLKIYDIWNNEKENLLEQTLKDLDKLKIELYLNFSNLSQRIQIKQLIESYNNNINDFYLKKNYFNYLTLEYYAETIKSQFLICNTILDLNNKKIFNFIDFENIDTLFLDKILSCIFENNLTIDIIKKIARSEIWRSFWGVSKDNIFDGKIKDWTDEQRSLVNFSKVLDNIREHMESPSEEIIADDDALDGWILYQHEKQVKEKKKQQISDRYNLDKKNSDEIFILTGDKNESKTIFELNDIQTRRDLKITNKLIEDKGILQESEVPHVKRQINHQLNLMNKERIRSN